MIDNHQAEAISRLIQVLQLETEKRSYLASFFENAVVVVETPYNGDKRMRVATYYADEQRWDYDRECICRPEIKEEVAQAAALLY